MSDQLEKLKLYYYQFCDFTTDYKVKFLKITIFLPFLMQIKQKLGPNVLQIWHFSSFSSYIYAYTFTQVFVQPLLVAFKT